MKLSISMAVTAMSNPEPDRKPVVRQKRDAAGDWFTGWGSATGRVAKALEAA